MSLLVTTPPRRRLSPWWTSAAARDRQRLIPPWMAVGLGLLVAGGLALTFPYQSLESRIARETRTVDPLRIEYLRLWLRVRPEEHGLRMLLARQLAEIGDYAGARAELRALPRDADPQAAARMALLEVDIGLREAYALAHDDARRERLLGELRAQLDAMTRTAWPASMEVELAERAAQAGAFDAAAFWHERLLARDAQLSANAWEAAARRMAALGASELAARLYFRAQSVATRRDEKRRLFVAALRTLEGAGLYDAALAAAEVQLGVLGNDTATLEFLTRFALAANRPDVAQRYATRLLRLSLAPAAIAAWQARFAAPVPPEWIALVDEPRLVRAQADSAQPDDRLPEPKLPFDDRIYTLSYEVFLANRNLKDALAVAQSAVRQAPKNTKWRLRLAQVADWSGNAALALEQWHAYARLTDDAAAWREVLARAPQVFDYTRWTEALERELRRQPDDPSTGSGQALETLRKLVLAHELLGEPERAIALLRRHERGPHRRAVLDLKDVDAVFIGTPCDLHAEMAAACLEAGKYVYCEKPLAITAEGVGRVLQAARRSRAFLQIGQQLRYFPSMREAIRQIHEGIAGKTYIIKAHRHGGRSRPRGSDAPAARQAVRTAWYADVKRSGDLIVENAVHNIDACNWIANSRPVSAYGHGKKYFPQPVPPGKVMMDGFSVEYIYENDMHCDYSQISFHPRHLKTLPSGMWYTVFGEKGSVYLT
ncbi:hypothetical protein FBR04_20820, partial [Betaproteobacteria bacterium PRO7]|nr:hypothetical protein [Betaproteobacteria bacterium PRO7]